jgi:hypothetical protein
MRANIVNGTIIKLGVVDGNRGNVAGSGVWVVVAVLAPYSGWCMSCVDFS